MRCEKLVSGVLLTCACGISVMNGSAQAPQRPQAGEVQTAPITEPISAEPKPGGAVTPKGIQAITQTDTKCSTRIIVNANALFEAGRWTLNSDATPTLDALGPLIVKTGRHPVRIVAFTRSAESDSNNQVVAERRARSVQTWLKDRGLVPGDATTEGFGTVPLSAKGPKERLEVVIDTCKDLPSPKQTH